jgi:hypothetical protein
MNHSVDTISRAATPGWYGVNPTTTDLKASPHAHYKHLREVQPVNLTPLGEWRLSHYDDIQKLLKHSHSGMRPTIEPLVISELERVAPSGEMDLVADLALAVPAASMCAMLGAPFEDRHELTKLVSLVTYRLAKQAYPHLQEQSEAAIMELAT